MKNTRFFAFFHIPPPPPSSEEMLLPVVDTVNPKLTLVRSASEAVGTH